MLSFVRSPQTLTAIVAVAALLTGGMIVSGSLRGSSMAHAQAPALSTMSTEDVLKSVIAGWMSGESTAVYLSPEMLEVVKDQTSGTGVYTELKDQGTVKSIKLVSSRNLPKGVLHQLRVEQDKGFSDWLVGRAPDGKVIFITFEPGSGTPTPPLADPLCFLVGAQLC